jgi:hypothetical protein
MKNKKTMITSMKEPMAEVSSRRTRLSRTILENSLMIMIDAWR